MSDCESDDYSVSDPWDDVSLWSAPASTTKDSKPKVLIVGAGIGGLMLGNLLLQAASIARYSSIQRKSSRSVGSPLQKAPT